MPLAPIKVTVLGSGTSMGVPTIGCTCPVCHSSDPHDRRTRPSVMLAKESVNRAYETTLAEGIRFERRIFHSTFSTHDQKEGMAAWKAWVEKHQAALAAMGGPLGKTKKVDQQGIADVTNAIGAFTVVRAASHEAAAKMFEDHPHFSIFPGESVEIMPVLPIPTHAFFKG